MAVSIRQQASADGTGPVSWPAPPLENSLLLAISFHRSAAGATASINDASWTKRVERTTLLSNTAFRRGLAVFVKDAAGASEPTSVQITWSPAQTHRTVLVEIVGDAGEIFSFLEKADNDNGATSGDTSVSTGTTASVASGAHVKIGVLGLRHAGTTFTEGNIAWTNGLSADVFYTGGSNGRTVMAGIGTDATAGTKESTVSWTEDAANSGVSSAILVFSTAAAGETKTITTSLEGAISRQLLVSGSMDAAIVASFAETASLNAAISVAMEAVSAAESLVQMAITTAASLEGIAGAQVEASAAIDAAISDFVMLMTSLDANIGGGGSITAALAGVASAASSVAASLDANIGSGETRAVIASLQSAVQMAIETQAALDAAIQTASDEGADLEALVEAARAVVTALDAHIIVPGEFSSFTLLQAAIIGLVTATVMLDAAASTARSASLAFDASIGESFAIATDLAAVVNRILTATVGLEGAVLAQAATSTAIEAFVGDIASGAIATDLEALVARMGLLTLQGHGLIAAVPFLMPRIEAFIGGVPLTGMRSVDAIGDMRIAAAAGGGQRIALARESSRTAKG